MEKIDILIQVKRFKDALSQNQTLLDAEQTLDNILDPDLVEKIH